MVRAAVRGTFLGAAAVLAVACGNGDDDSGSASSDGTLIHTWDFLNSNGSAGAGLTFASDGSYVQDTVHLTSSTTANVEEVKGTYSVAGSTVTLVPEEGSCTGSDPAQVVPFVLGSSTLTMSYSYGVIVYQVDTVAPSSVAITFGCFDSSGDFMPEPITPITSGTADAGQ